jgi:hypothetical protein
MTNDIHSRALGLIRKAWIEVLTPDEESWLREHLSGCTDCAARDAQTRAAVDALRSEPFTAEPTLVESTRRLVRWRAQQLRETHERSRMVVFACVMSFVWGVITAPLVWRLMAWLGEAAAMPEVVSQVAFLVVVLAPGIVAALVLLRRPVPEFIHMRGAGE